MKERIKEILDEILTPDRNVDTYALSIHLANGLREYQDKRIAELEWIIKTRNIKKSPEEKRQTKLANRARYRKKNNDVIKAKAARYRELNREQIRLYNKQRRARIKAENELYQLKGKYRDEAKVL